MLSLYIYIMSIFLKINLASCTSRSACRVPTCPAPFFHYNPTRYPAKRTKGTPRSNLPPFRRHKPFRNEQTMDTLTRFLPEHLQQNQLPEALGGVLLSVVSACTEINAKVRLGALAGVLGMAGTGNIQGEDQKNWMLSPTTL